MPGLPVQGIAVFVTMENFPWLMDSDANLAQLAQGRCRGRLEMARLQTLMGSAAFALLVNIQREVRRVTTVALAPILVLQNVPLQQHVPLAPRENILLHPGPHLVPLVWIVIPERDLLKALLAWVPGGLYVATAQLANTRYPL